MKKGITLLSTYAKDVLLNESGELLSELKGGPLFFMDQVLKSTNISYNKVFGDEMVVEVLIKDGIEKSKINPVKQKDIPIEKLNEWTILSTILREWNIDSLKRYKGKLFIDIQGYVRDGSKYGGKQIWTELEDEQIKAACLKGTAEEMQYLPKNILENQKQRLMIITNGADDIVFFYRGNKLSIKPKPIISPKDTIGAGDTFFTHAVCNLYKKLPVREAIQLAADATSEFLSRKNLA
jgi:hypothetical protein